jgi:hypothetical protein
LKTVPKSKIFTNGMVDLHGFVDFDPADIGVKRKSEILGSLRAYGKVQGDELKDAIKDNLVR